MNCNIAVLLVGAVFLICGIVVLVEQLKKRKNNTVSAEAEVAEYYTEIRRESEHDSIVYYPVLKYYANGEWQRVRHDVGTGRQKYAVGEHVDILYDPDRPESCLIEGDHNALLMGFIAIAIGIGVGILSFFAH